MKIEVTEVIENDDGTCNVVFDYDDEFVEHVRKELQKEHVTEEDIAQYVIESFEKGMDLLEKDSE
jgi:hypothetical protein